MSLDVYLNRKKWISYDAGKTFTEENETIYDANITHNLGKMAGEAGIYNKPQRKPTCFNRRMN